MPPMTPEEKKRCQDILGAHVKNMDEVAPAHTTRPQSEAVIYQLARLGLQLLPLIKTDEE